MSAARKVEPGQRFTGDRRCPICGGAEDDRRKQGVRCNGYLDNAGEYARCSRREKAGGLEENGDGTYSHRLNGPCLCGVEHGPPPLRIHRKPSKPKGPPGKLVASHDYQDADGNLVMQVRRYEGPDGKTYRPYHLNDRGQWVPKDPPGPLPLYRLPTLLSDPLPIVWVCEGEKAADAGAVLGLTVTTSAHGAKSAGLSDWSPLAGRTVVILPDNDPDGERYAADVVALLGQLDPRPVVRVLRLPDLPEKGDLVDWNQALPEAWDAEMAVAELERLASEVPVVDFGRGGVSSVLSVPGGKAPDPTDLKTFSDSDLGIVRARSVKSYRIRWVWEHRIAEGSMSMLAGDGSAGKTLLALLMAAIVSNGGPWPDGSGLAPRGTVIIVSAEDRPEDTLKPRLIALGADLDRIIFLKAQITIRKPGKEDEPLIHPRSFQDLDYWREVFRRFPDCRLLVVDPVPAYLGRGVNDHKNNEVRAVLEPFLQNALPADCAMLCISHLGKSVDTKTPAQRILGSVAYSNLARNVHVAFRDAENPERRIFGQVKCNNAPDGLPSMAYRVETRTIEDDGVQVETAVPVFEEQTFALNLQQAMAQQGKPGPDPVNKTKLAEWLFDHLKDHPGSQPVGAVFAAAGEAGLIGTQKDDGKWSNGTALYRARDHVRKLASPRDGYTIKEQEIDRSLVRIGGRPLPPGRALMHWSLALLDDGFCEPEY